MKLINNDPTKFIMKVEISHDELRVIRGGVRDIPLVGDLEASKYYAKVGYSEEKVRQLVYDSIEIMEGEKIEF